MRSPRSHRRDIDALRGAAAVVLLSELSAPPATLKRRAYSSPNLLIRQNWE
ncbi:MAG: hypothetical protein ACREYC_15395 [Gammaproteobacteria bacterium]